MLGLSHLVTTGVRGTGAQGRLNLNHPTSKARSGAAELLVPLRLCAHAGHVGLCLQLGHSSSW